MKKYLSLLLLTIGFLFASCGGDDITPPGQPNPDPSFTIEEIIGKKEGIVKINLLPGTNESVSEVGEVIAFQKEGDKSKLSVTFVKPNIITGGGASATDFKITDKECHFLLGSYTTTSNVLEGDKIPVYIKKWFPNNNIVKVEIDKMSCVEGANYDISLATMSMTYITDLLIHDADGKEPIRGFSLEFEYIGLKNQ